MPTKGTKPKTPNFWDLIAFFLVMGLISLMAWGSHQMTIPYTPGKQIPISLDPLNLPVYAIRTVLRMVIALAASLLFTFTYATLAAKNRRAETVLLPVLDILQSVPILGFLSVTVTGFIAMFPGSLFGVELAAIFAIFTSQAWNMAFSFYQSLKIVPNELQEASKLFRLSPWQRFWKLEVPYATPNLIWNTMMSVSGGWFFVVASEAITVGKTSVTLPGIGSYVAEAIAEKNLAAIASALLTMLLVIIIYDQLCFRPLVAWSEKFKFELTESSEAADSWVLLLFQRAYFFRQMVYHARHGWHSLLDHLPRLPERKRGGASAAPRGNRRLDLLLNILLWSGMLAGCWLLFTFIASGVSQRDVLDVFALGLLTLLRVMVLLVVACIIWVPLGVLIGLNASLAMRIQPLAQFLAAFPANLFFPVAVFLMVRYRLSPEIWTAPLMILGTQWYILFNVIAGATAIPSDLLEAARNMGLSGWRIWRKLLLPGIVPSLITGLITASGGTWNASIVSEVVSWGNTRLMATGLGSYIALWTEKGDYPHIVLGIAVMSIYVVGLNRLVWRRLYSRSQTRYRLG